MTVTPERLAALREEARRGRAAHMSEAEVDAARRADPDALPPMTDAEIDAAKGANPRR